MADEQNLSVMIPVDIEAEMRKSYLDYAMSVIIGRALPDVRDGLKPVHGRILYAMHEMNLMPGRKYSKCAGVVGEVLKKFHPHGDTPVYDALVRMAQTFNMRYPLIDGQGNFGSVDGDPPAAYRYTECRLAPISMEILADIDKDTVDFVPNFDEGTLEPTVLPTRVPNLLVNGASGIAVGMATNIPPHNLREIIDATMLLIEKPDTTLKEVMKLVPGPDFPTGGYIAGRDGIEAAYKSGRGSFTMRAKAAIEESGKDRESVVVTEIPYQVNKATLIEGIADVRDESDRDGMRIVIELKRGEESQLILNNLFKHTQMQESFGMIMLAIVGGQPREMGLLEFIRLFIEHRRDVVLRRTRYELRKAREREHILVGYQIALDHLDDVIRIIRGSASRAEAKENLLKYFTEQDVTITENGKSRKLEGVKLDGRKYKLGPIEGEAAGRGATLGLTPIQVDAILELQLHRLTQLSVDEILKELKSIREHIAELEEILSTDKKLKQVISGELKEVQKAYGDDRRTQIVDKVDEIKLEDLIADTDMLITVSHAGYIKRTAADTYRHQSRGGKGRIGARTKEEDFVEHLFIASAHSYILLFTSKGRVYWLKVYELPEAAAATRGKAISSLVKFQEDEKLTALVAARNLEEADKFVFMATKKMIFLASHDGQAILFRETEVRPMGRNAGGVNGMDLAKDDYVVSMDAVQPDFEIIAKEHKTTTQNLEELENEQIKDSLVTLMLTVAEKGYGKRTPLAEYRITSRGGKGVVNMKTTDRNGYVVATLQVTEESDVMIITHNGKVIRVHANEIREAGRSTQGVRLLRLEADDSVAAAAVLQEENEEEKK